MNLSAIQTHAIKAGESLIEILDRYITTLEEDTIVAITSKVVSLCQGKVIPKQQVESKEALIQQEADAILEDENRPYGLYLTLKQNLLIPSAGIDESNGEGVYILYPEAVQETAATIWQHLKTKHHLKQVGVLITDSHTTPLRRGVTGIALGWCGFEPLYSYIGKPDIFGAPLRVTQINILDALAASAVFVMGEGAEQTPLVKIQQALKIQFTKQPPSPETEASVIISMQEDIYAPLLRQAPWRFKKTR